MGDGKVRITSSQSPAVGPGVVIRALLCHLSQPRACPGRFARSQGQSLPKGIRERVKGGPESRSSAQDYKSPCRQSSSL